MSRDCAAAGPVRPPERNRSSRLLGVLSLLLLILAGCGGRGSDTAQVTKDTPPAPALVLTVSTPAVSGHPGDPIALTAVLTNHSQAPITVCTWPGFRFELVIRSGDHQTSVADGGRRRIRTPGATSDTPTMASDFTTLPPGGATSVTRELLIPASPGAYAATMSITATFTSGAIGIEHGLSAWTGTLQGTGTVQVSQR
jgi:hypothetical protein